MGRTLEQVKAGWSWGSDMWAVEWIYDQHTSTDSDLRYLAYDANMWPMRKFSEWKVEKTKTANIKKALDIFDGLNVDVWLDDVQIKFKEEK